MSTARTWYVSCSPRSPEKIAPELDALSSLEGAMWRERNSSGKLVNQIEFANRLSRLASFEGSISVNNPDFSARDRFAPMQTYGFAFVDSSGVLRITPAGYQLIEGARFQELFLKQMLKWQYPSWQHGGNSRTRHLYPPPTEMNIFPFVETLRVCREVEGLSKNEIAMFMLPTLNYAEIPQTIETILEFRKEKENYHGRHRKEFIAETHINRFQQLYSNEITSGNIGTRESQTSTISTFIRKKIRNSLDVADATIRYFRATGLFTLSADFHGLRISDVHQAEVNQILDEMTFETVDFYDDVDRFYEHMGNIEYPTLPWHLMPNLLQRAISLGATRSELKDLSSTEIRDFIETQEQEETITRLRAYEESLQADDTTDDIILTFNHILNRDVVDPALFFEWNTWRALVSIDDYREARPNFVLDDDLRPYSTAPGNKPDMEIEYNDTFITLVEVTLSGGARQYDTEGEPVTRHIGRIQYMETQQKNPRAVYGLFIAPSINPNTRHYFYVHLKHVSNPQFGGYLNIIPLTLDQFIDIFRFCRNFPAFNRSVIKDLYDRIVELKKSTNNADEWGNRICTEIEVWKTNWQSKVTAHV
ncbi:MAG: AlwI family type II restriction endonuclease [Methanotrichaceae archaeon]